MAELARTLKDRAEMRGVGVSGCRGEAASRLFGTDDAERGNNKLWYNASFLGAITLQIKLF